MDIVRFDPDKDLTSLEYYLRNSYLEERRARSWLPARLHDVIYRVGAQEMDEGRERSADYMFLWKEDGDITACILPDGENIYISVKTGCEYLFPSVVKFGEENCLPLFTQTGKGSVKFWVAVNDSFRYMHQILSESGYGRYTDVETASCMRPMKTDPVIKYRKVSDLCTERSIRTKRINGVRSAWDSIPNGSRRTTEPRWDRITREKSLLFTMTVLSASSQMRTPKRKMTYALIALFTLIR